MFKILLEQFLIPPLRRGSEGGGGKESGRREENGEGRREGTREGGKEGGDCRLDCSSHRALRKAGGRGEACQSRALPGRRGWSFGVGRPIVGVAAWVAMGTGLFPGRL